MKKLSTQNLMMQFFTESGMPKSMVAVLVYLLICEPPRQAASTIENVTSLSKGSVNNALQSFIKSGLVCINKTESDRHYYYELDSNGWQRAINQRLNSLARATIIAERGLEEFPDNIRLKSMYEAYRAFSDQYNKLNIPD